MSGPTLVTRQRSVPLSAAGDPERPAGEACRVGFIRYANCWEDERLLLEAFGPLQGRRVLSIASGGDNAFALLAAGAAEVVAADLSHAQLACVELKAAAVAALPREEVLAFLGISPAATERRAVLERIAPRLSERSRAFWLARPEAVDGGLIHAGKFENYFRLFRTRILPLVHGRRTVAALMEPRDEAGRRRFYDQRWNTLRWRLLFRVFFSRAVMGRLGRSPSFFRHVEGSVADRILRRAEYALTALRTDDNPYLDYILNGNFTRSPPAYLQPGVFEQVRAGLDRLRLFEGAVEDAADANREGGFDAFNLSDIFEYMDGAAAARVYGRLLDAARPGARLAYWNMLVPRACPSACADRVTPLADLSRRLHARDRAFFYSAFVVEQAGRAAGGGA